MMSTQVNNIRYIKSVDFKIFSLYHVILPISGTFDCTFFHLLFGYILIFSFRLLCQRKWVGSYWDLSLIIVIANSYFLSNGRQSFFRISIHYRSLSSRLYSRLVAVQKRVYRAKTWASVYFRSYFGFILRKKNLWSLSGS